MKIRDIQQYLEGYSPLCSIEKLGTDEEKFLETLYGFGQEIDSTIRDVASFASNSEEQLFYEFVQNAFDANADSLCFFLDENYLIVLNNGEPFFTDKFDHKSKRLRDGQLYNFLAKGKSLKAGDNTKSGEYGQGSKLLYTLISDKSTASNKTQLLKAIKDNRKGPYLISWGSPEQLSDFRFRDPEWEYTDPYAAQSDLLVTKILMTYYPIAPGVDETYFSKNEFLQIRDAFERLVDPKKNINRLSKGTAIIVPLGQGQYEAISAKDNLKKVTQRLGGFAALTSDKVKNSGKHLDHIFVCGTEVEMHTVKSLFINFDKDDEYFEYQFAFNPSFAKIETVNLYKTLPIIQAHYGLGFLVDSPNFELDSSRQRINDTGKTRLQLTEAFTQLLEQIKKIQKTDPALFDLIYTCIVESQPLKNNSESLFISEPFYAVFKPFIKENVKTEDGSYLPLENVREDVEGEPRIPLHEVGIDNIKWISEDISKGKLKQRFELTDMQSYPIEDIFADAQVEKLSSWIKTLSKETYLSIHPYLLDSFASYDTDCHVFLTSKGNVLSYSDIISTQSKAFFYRDNDEISIFDRCPDLEYALGAIDINESPTDNNEVISLHKIVNNIDFFRASSSHIDVACNIIEFCSNGDRYNNIENAIRNHIPLFQNLNGDYCVFSDLIGEVPQGNAVLSTFCAAGYIPDCFAKNWMITGDEEIWDWLRKNTDKVTALGDWGEYHSKYLDDIKALYENAGEGHSEERIQIYLDEDGIPVEDKIFSIATNRNLSAEEYDLFSDFAQTKGYNIVARKFENRLTSAPFELEKAEVSDILDDYAKVDSKLFDIIIKLYNTILWNYTVQPDGYSFVLRKENSRNYICPITDVNADSILHKHGYVRIDDSVASHFKPTDLEVFNLVGNPKKMKEIISESEDSSLIALFPYVKLCNDEVIEQYFRSFESIEINSPVSEEDNRWQIIKFALSRIQAGQYQYRQSLLSILYHNGGQLPDTIKSNKVIYNESVYDLYKLLGQIKEDNELTDSLAACLPEGDYFLKVLYSGKEETAEAEDVFDELKNMLLDVEQLRFCLDYATHEEDVDDTLTLSPKTSLREALTMISRYQFKDFDNYLDLENFDKDIQVLADNNLLLPEERIPEIIRTWLTTDSIAPTLISGLLHETEPYIAFRQAYLDDSMFMNVGRISEDSDRLERTIKWIVNQRLEIEYPSNRYFNFHSLLFQLPEEMEDIPMFRISGKTAEKGDGYFVPVLSIEYLPANGALTELSNVLSDGNTRIIAKKPEVKEFFSTHKIYGYPDTNFIVNHGLSDRTRYQFRIAAEEKEYTELSNKIYTQWRTLPSSEGVRIFTSPSPVGTIFSITEEPSHDVVLDVKSHDNLYGYNSELKHVIIQHPNQERLTEMKTLEEASKSIEFFKNPFIALQGLYIDMMEDLTPEEMAMVVANKDKLNNLLEDMSTDDENTPESKVRKLIGYIGEQIYKLYLEKNQVEYEYSAEKGVGEYDFKLPGHPDIYVDVKTNLYSFVDSAVPFYIHKTQNKFMQQHPEAQYRIVRISLTDIRLKKEYEHLRGYFGAEEDFELNEELRSRCQKIAMDYWRGAKIKEFDAASPEYGIRIERKK